MKLTKSQKEKIISFAKEKYKLNNVFHNFEHAEQTAKLAKKLARLEKADPEICEIAGLLHDIAHHKGKEEHASLSADAAKSFLKSINVSEEIAEKVHEAISHHNSKYSGERTKEANVVFDADHILGMGPIGFCRDLAYCLLEQKMSINEAVKDGKDYILSRYEKIKTKSAKKIAKPAQDLMIKFYQKFDQQT